MRGVAHDLEPPDGSAITEPRVSSPWLWDWATPALVYAVTFHHPRIMQ